MKARMFVLACVAALAAGAAGCERDEPRPIAVEGQVLWVHNLTADTWRDVEVWLNTHYRVTRAQMPPGERFGIPLDSFVAGYGQRFSPKRQVVQRIEVRARTAAGQPVRLLWGS